MKINKYKNPVCRGSFVLRSACGHCERCIEQLEKICIGGSGKFKLSDNYENDNLVYAIADNGGFYGVANSVSMVEFASDVDGCVTVTEGQINKEDFNEMCIAWLCLFKPEVIAEDKKGAGK